MRITHHLLLRCCSEELLWYLTSSFASDNWACLMQTYRKQSQLRVNKPLIVHFEGSRTHTRLPGECHQHCAYDDADSDFPGHCSRMNKAHTCTASHQYVFVRVSSTHLVFCSSMCNTHTCIVSHRNVSTGEQLLDAIVLRSMNNTHI